MNPDTATENGTPAFGFQSNHGVPDTLTTPVFEPTHSAREDLAILTRNSSFSLLRENTSYSDPMPSHKTMRPKWERRLNAKTQINRFKNVVIDGRGNRQGNGDLTSGYLMALQIAEDLQFRGQLTLIVDIEALRILKLLTGREVRSKDFLCDGRLKILTKQDVPPDFGVSDLYLSFARPSGSLRYATAIKQSDMDALSREENPAYEPDNDFFPVPIGDNTVYVVQTVLGNTENKNSKNPNGLIKMGNSSADLSPPGLGENESGIYDDPTARRLRGLERVEIAAELELNFSQMTGERAGLLHDIVARRTLKGAMTGFAYGISANTVNRQFEKYLRGACDYQDSPAGLKRPIVIFSPSATKQYEDLANGKSFHYMKRPDPRLRDRLILIDDPLQIPAVAEPEKIYLVRTGALPLRVFNGLLAYAEYPPIVSGDCAMSAAIAIGKPFVMTEVLWNIRNVAELKRKLTDLAPELADAIGEIFIGETKPGFHGPEPVDPNLERAHELLDPGARRAFFALAETVPLLGENLFPAIGAFRDAHRTPSSATSLPRTATDFQSKLRLHLQSANEGDDSSQRILYGILKRDNALFFNLVRRKKIAPTALRHQKIQSLLMRHFAALTAPDQKDDHTLDGIKKTIFSGMVQAHREDIVEKFILDRANPAARKFEPYQRNSDDYFIKYAFEGFSTAGTTSTIATLRRLLTSSDVRIAKCAMASLLELSDINPDLENDVSFLLNHAEPAFAFDVLIGGINSQNGFSALNRKRLPVPEVLKRLAMTLIDSPAPELRQKAWQIVEIIAPALSEAEYQLQLVHAFANSFQIRHVKDFDPQKKALHYRLERILKDIPWVNSHVTRELIGLMRQTPEMHRECLYMLRDVQGTQRLSDSQVSLILEELERSGGMPSESGASITSKLDGLFRNGETRMFAAQIIGTRAKRNAEDLALLERIMEEKHEENAVHNALTAFFGARFFDTDFIPTLLDFLIKWSDIEGPHQRQNQEILHYCRTNSSSNGCDYSVFRAQLKKREAHRFDELYQFWLDHGHPIIGTELGKMAMEEQPQFGPWSMILAYEWHGDFIQRFLS